VELNLLISSARFLEEKEFNVVLLADHVIYWDKRL
jgi:hypothetical protein